MTVQVVPQKSYDVEVYFHVQAGRWFAKFSSARNSSISYDFPLCDVPPYVPHANMPALRQEGKLGEHEEAVLSLVFSQMVAMITAQQAREAMARAIGASVASAPAAAGATETVLD